VLNIGTNRDPLCREREARQKAEAEVERLRSQSPTPVWPEIVRLQGKIAELEGQLLSARNDSFNLANALSASEKKLEVAHKQLKNYTNAIETL
jgi:chromosome segregation ATPase